MTQRQMRGCKCLLILMSLTLTPLCAQERMPVRQIAASARPAVVTVGAIRAGELIGFGSGFVIREDGVIATNRHVVESADTVRVTLESGEIYDNVYVLGHDDRRDLVILQIPATGLATLDIGDDRTSEVGDPVYVMGNPLGLEGTFSDGLLSAKRVEEGVAYLQITAPISEGSSGGPVLDASGRVIGIATLMYTDGQNLNVAVPARYAAGLLALPGTAVPFASVAAEFRPAAERIDPDSVLELLPEEARVEFDDFEPWERQVALRMVGVRMAVDDDGWEPFDDGRYALLDDGDVATAKIRLRPGHYQVIGVCDDDCTDLDMVVTGPDDEEIGRDVLLDPLPAVEFTVRRRGDYHIDVSMESCSTDSCFYGFQLFKER